MVVGVLVVVVVAEVGGGVVVDGVAVEIVGVEVSDEVEEEFAAAAEAGTDFESLDFGEVEAERGVARLFADSVCFEIATGVGTWSVPERCG